MPTPGEHKTVQARILAYAKELGWAVVPREEAERRRGFNAVSVGRKQARVASLYLENVLFAQVRRFKPLSPVFTSRRNASEAVPGDHTKPADRTHPHPFITTNRTISALLWALSLWAVFLR